MTSHSISPLARLYWVQSRLESLGCLQTVWCEATVIQLARYGVPEDLAFESVHAFQQAAIQCTTLAAELLEVRHAVGKLLPAEPY